MQRAELNQKDSDQRAWKPALAFLAILFAGLAAGVLILSSQALAAGRQMHIHCNFTPKERSEWQFPHPADWEIKSEGGIHYLHMVRPAEPGVPRRPLQFARLRNVNLGSFDLHVRVRRYGSSLIVVFNYVDTLHFYYAHISRDLGTKQPVHNGIFLVDGAPRRRIAGTQAQPALPDTNWHSIRIVRNVRTGLIDVYSDVQKKPLFSVVDKTFQCGQVGLGSFDETGDFTDFDLRSDDGGCTPSLAKSAEMLLKRPSFQP
jgi:hypothetical protein